jgi:DNA-binding transcriptional regulator YbjK
VIDVDWHPWARHADTAAYHHLADLADRLEKRSLAWFDELNAAEHERFAAELEGDVQTLAAIAEQIRALRA